MRPWRLFLVHFIPVVRKAKSADDDRDTSEAPAANSPAANELNYINVAVPRVFDVISFRGSDGPAIRTASHSRIQGVRNEYAEQQRDQNG